MFLRRAALTTAALSDPTTTRCYVVLGGDAILRLTLDDRGPQVHRPLRIVHVPTPQSGGPQPPRIEDILDQLEQTHSPEDLDLVHRAYVFSARVHRGQERLSGEPYLNHPLAVAKILAELDLDATSIAVGLLHDVLEDTHASQEEIEEMFGEDVGNLVDGVTKISKISFTSKEQEQAENFRKLVLAMTEDIRVLMVKLADRLHNMRTLEYLKPEAQIRNARETSDIYAPLARRLGIGKIQTELEVLSLRYLEPDDYKKLADAVEAQPDMRKEFITRVHQAIEDALQREGIEAHVEHRVKSLSSIHKKLRKGITDLDQVYDVIAFRIITDSEQSCYAALGIVHGLWRPVPGRFKDFIAMPKRNMYQSLHTTVIDEGRPFELQIRTEQMHKVAEEGIAAHWMYKEGGLDAEADAQQFQWLRHIVELQRDMPDARDFLSSLKIDLYPGEVYAFTPTGDVKVIPRGSSPIDFAYAVHTEVGHHCVGSKVNGSLVPLRTELRNGDIVEIITSPDARPNRDWLRLVRTSRARSKIRSFINKRERDRSIEVGTRLCEKDLRKLGLQLKKVVAQGRLDEIASQFGVARGDDLLAAVGFGKVSPRQVVERLLPPEELEERERHPRKAGIGDAVKRALGWDVEPSVKVEGMDDILVHRARCCSPLPGEPIVGYVTRGKGVSVHSEGCPNVTQLLLNPERRVPVVWTSSKKTVQPVGLELEVEDRQGVLADVTAVVSGQKTNIRHMESHLEGSGGGQISLVIDVVDLKQLNMIKGMLLKIDGVRSVHRQRSV